MLPRWQVGGPALQSSGDREAFELHWKDCFYTSWEKEHRNDWMQVPWARCLSSYTSMTSAVN